MKLNNKTQTRIEENPLNDLAAELEINGIRSTQLSPAEAHIWRWERIDRFYNEIDRLHAEVSRLTIENQKLKRKLKP